MAATASATSTLTDPDDVGRLTSAIAAREHCAINDWCLVHTGKTLPGGQDVAGILSRHGYLDSSGSPAFPRLQSNKERMDILKP